MKANLFCLSLVLLLANSGFSQVPQKNQPAKKKDSVPPILMEKTVISQPKLVAASAVNPKPKEESAILKNPNLVSASIVNAKPNSEVSVTRNPNLAPAKPTVVPGSIPPQPNILKATLLDAFVTVTTGTSSQTFPVTSGDNKDPDTHWSCGVFDQNGRPITSFHDNSDNDEYVQGSVTGPLQMHIDNPAVLGDFATNGHLHINIAPNGNDTWGITRFVLALDFQNPSLSQKITWPGFTLTQDTRDIDLYFLWDGRNLVVRQ
jgi:hypothetical protein